MSQVLQEVPKYFEGLYTNVFTLRRQELVDYPGIDTHQWKLATVRGLERINCSSVDEKAVHWRADNLFPSD